jgi:hypothetical protein
VKISIQREQGETKKINLRFNDCSVDFSY